MIIYFKIDRKKFNCPIVNRLMAAQAEQEMTSSGGHFLRAPCPICPGAHKGAHEGAPLFSLPLRRK